MNWINFLVGPIVSGVVDALTKYHEKQLFEKMQGEILEGWVYKIEIEVERALKKHNCEYEVYRDVARAINKVVDEEFDTTKI